MPVDNEPVAAEPTADDSAASSPATPLPLWQRAGWLAAGAWVVVYLLVWATGQRFSTAYLDYGWQLVPWDTLSTRPLQSVWFLHIQPPLWNLSLGGLARVS